MNSAEFPAPMTDSAAVVPAQSESGGAMLPVEAATTLPVVPTRESISALESAMLALPTSARIDCPVQHDFAPGLYVRTIYMPAGATITSKIHKTQHFFVVSKGKCLVVDTHGNKLLIEAPYMGVTEPWTKRALHIVEDCIWSTFHVTDKTDVDAIERDIIAPDFAEAA